MVVPLKTKLAKGTGSLGKAALTLPETLVAACAYPFRSKVNDNKKKIPVLIKKRFLIAHVSFLFLTTLAETIILTSYKAYNGTATSIMVVASDVGVINAASTRITTTACFRYVRIKVGDISPILERK